ncbi:hypothetical protein K474DRAFT_1113766 [Panus rudis PR-1116 ss-1]|nr:hypothetical protein K474DRAFT_1113766 [Panus rudis PR-1116 ss-1]
MFFCEPCARSFASQAAYHSHLSGASAHKPIKCLLPARKSKHSTHEEPLEVQRCKKAFKTYDALLGHYSRIHADLLPICPTCVRSFPTISDFGEHIVLYHGSDEDPSLSLDSTSQSELPQRPSNSDHAEQPVIAEQPPTGVASGKAKLPEDMTPRFYCQLCTQFSSQAVKYCAHLRSAKHQKPIACPFNNVSKGIYDSCGKRFATVSALQAHATTQHGADLLIPCVSCVGLCFVNEDAYTQHVEQGHPKQPCSICDETFVTSVQLAQHIALRHPLIQCPKCSGYIHLDTLHDHACKISDVMIKKTCASTTCIRCAPGHEGSKDNETPSLNPSQHRRHISLTCSLCLQEFADMTSYRMHWQITHAPNIALESISPTPRASPIYNSQKLYRCDLCNLTFKKRKQLKRHHQQPGQHPVCAPCEKAFVDEVSYEQHIVEVHRPATPLRTSAIPPPPCGVDGSYTPGGITEEVHRTGVGLFLSHRAQSASSQTGISSTTAISSDGNPASENHVSSDFIAAGASDDSTLRIPSPSRPNASRTSGAACASLSSYVNVSGVGDEAIPTNAGRKPWACRLCTGRPLHPVGMTCGHIFCLACILHEFSTASCCPTCGQPMYIRLKP